MPRPLSVSPPVPSAASLASLSAAPLCLGWRFGSAVASGVPAVVALSLLSLPAALLVVELQ